MILELTIPIKGGELSELFISRLCISCVPRLDMGRNKYISCSICLKNIRSDKIRYHTHTKVQVKKYKMKICSICKKVLIAGNIARHLRVHAKKSHSQLVEIIKSDQKENKEKIEEGKFIEDYIKTEKIDPQTLRREHRQALQMKVDPPVIDATLRIWQEKLLKYIKPSEREILWIVGSMGNEGKSWFQGYLRNLHGASKAFRINIRKNSDGILHVLSKKMVHLIDLFMFNVPRSFDMEDFPYEFIEEIKDGYAASTKYESSMLEFKFPNTVIVFSNERPDKDKMSKDRWNVFSIGNEHLFKGNGSKAL